MPPWGFLSAQILQTVVTMFVMAAVIVAIGWAFYDVHPQRDALGGFVLYVLLGSATMCALGIAFTRITTTADSASAIGPFATVILAFVSGVFIPVASLPDWLRDVGRVFPLAHLAEGLQRRTRRRRRAAGSTPPTSRCSRPGVSPRSWWPCAPSNGSRRARGRNDAHGPRGAW